MALVTLTLIAAACGDVPSAVAPAEDDAAPASVLARIDCSADVGAGILRCAPPTAVGGPRADLMLGGQDTYVRLANHSIVVADGTFSTDVTVQNLTAQAMGTPNGTTLSERGVRVFFAAEPTNGVVVANADGAAMFTASGQPFFQYDQILHPQQVSAPRTWAFTLNGATSFAFSVYVSAEVPSEAGLLRWLRVEGVAAGSPVQSLAATRSAFLAVEEGGRIGRSTDGGATWSPFTPPHGAGGTPAIHAYGDTAIAVGYGSSSQTIGRSVDGGATWSWLSLSGTVRLSAVHGDGTTSVAVGANGAIRRSSDAGSTWQSVTSGTSAQFLAVWGEGNVWVAVGAGGAIHRSTDAGATWTPATSGTSATLNGIAASGTALVSVGASGTILRSTDGGATWAAVASGTSAILQDVHADGNTLHAVGDGGAMLRSADAGASWAPVASGITTGLRALTGNGSVRLAAGADGIVYRSADDSSWLAGGVPLPLQLRGVWGEDQLRVIVGEKGHVERSADGGSSWSRVTSGTGERLFDVAGGDGTVIAVGGDQTGVRSTDGGTTWQRFRFGADDPISLEGIWGDGQDFLIAGFLGTVYGSSDGGAIWGFRRGTRGAHHTGVARSGSVAVTVSSEGEIYRSTQGGATDSWVSVHSPTTAELTDVWAEGDAFVAVGSGGTVIRSTDLGSTWSVIPSGTTSRLNAVSGRGTTVLAVGDGGTILRSTDAGATWHPLHSGVGARLQDVWVLDEQDVWVVGDAGLILHGVR